MAVPKPAPQSRHQARPHPRLALWLESIAAADSARVMRLDLRPVVTRDSAGVEQTSWDTRIANEARVGREWITQFAALLAMGTGFDPNRSCAPADSPTSGTDQLVLGIRFGFPGSAGSALVLLREDCMQLLENDRPIGGVGIGKGRSMLLHLVSTALPGDQVVERLRDLPVPPERVVVALPPEADLPKLGEYVYVEELPEAITKVSPQYPAIARETGVDGTVLVQALVGPDGSVEEVQVQKSIPMLDAAAVTCVYQWRFKPALSKGMPVAVWVAVPLRFTLH